jgi:hypothetical protein
VRSSLKEKVPAAGYKTVINGRGELPRWPHDISLSSRVGTDIHRPTAVSHSVYFAGRLKNRSVFMK